MSPDTSGPVTVVKRFRKRAASAQETCMLDALDVEPSALVISDTESAQGSCTAACASPFQVANAKAGSGPRFVRPKPLPVCVPPVKPRFRSPFQLGHSGAVASDSETRLPASVVASLPSSVKSAKPLPAFLPVQPARPAAPKGAPLPRPLPMQASFYATYPSDAVVSGSLVPSCPAKAASSFLTKPLDESLGAPTHELQPPVPKSSTGFVSSRQVHQERSSAVLSLLLQLCTILQPLSKVLAGLQGSLHELELLHKVADTTAARYLRSALLFVPTVEDLGGSVLSLSDALAADAIFVLHRAGEGCLGHPSNVLKAVRWVTKTRA